MNFNFCDRQTNRQTDRRHCSLLNCSFAFKKGTGFNSYEHFNNHNLNGILIGLIWSQLVCSRVVTWANAVKVLVTRAARVPDHFARVFTRVVPAHIAADAPPLLAAGAVECCSHLVPAAGPRGSAPQKGVNILHQNGMINLNAKKYMFFLTFRSS